MRNDLWTKGLVIGIIILFLGASVLPSISGSLGEITKSDSNSLNQISYEKTSFDNNLNSPKTLGLTDGLIGYWNFDEGSGSVAHDSSGNGYDANIYGATWTTGKYGSALEIKDTSYVGDISASYDDSITTAFTVAAWVKWYGPSSYSFNCYIFDGRANRYVDNGLGFFFYIDRGYFELKLSLDRPGTDSKSTSTIPIGSWTHVAGVFDHSSNVCRLFINGTLDNTTTITNAFYQIDHSPAIGNNLWAPGDGQWAPLNGIEDEVRIYNRALSYDEIKQLAGGGNQPPTANFTYNPSLPTDLDVIQFTDASTDSDGTIASWNWDFGDGNTSALQNPTHKYADEGTYHVMLTVTDDDGASDTILKDVVVSNVAPVADADGSYNGTTDYAVQFNGSGSYDLDGVIVSYEWDFGDGYTGSGVQPTHRYDKYGVYNVTLAVTDNDGLTDTARTLAIINKGTPPIIQLFYPTDGEVLKSNVTVKWYAHDNIDGDNLPIYLYLSNDDGVTWSAFKGNPYSNNGKCDWDTTSLSDGAYKLLIEAVDSEGNVGTDSSSFQIKNHEQPSVNHEPVKPNKPSGPANGKIGQEYSYTTSTTDPDGDQVYYLWDWGDGNNSGWIGPYNSGSICEAKHIWNVKDNYNIKVKAKDIHGKESSWSDPLPIIMPYSFNNPILQFLELLFQRFPHAFPILRHMLGY